MGIVADDIAKVRAATDIVAVISEHTEVKRSGRQWMARCPLHGERTPSLSVSPDKGVYYCFGCQRSGDVITFVQEIEGLDFAGAVEMLAARAGIQLHYTSRDESAARGRRKRLLEAVEKARDFYHQRLLDGRDAGPARHYLRSRGYDGDLVRRWKLGWAPDDWDVLARHLKLTDDDLRDSGLGFVNRAGRQQDFFRGRVLFPIDDERGEVVGFGGRIMPGADGPKYLNTSTDARTYDKSRVLYGLHEHRRQIVKEGQAVVCEGYTDVIGCAEAGIELAVATCGTALTEDHVRLLKRFSAGRLVLAFDADAAGAAAAARVYAWERQFELEVLVADLPSGQDPGDLARSDPDELRRAVSDAVPLLKFRVDRALDGADLSTIESRARAAERAVAIVNEHPDPVARDRHLMRIADTCDVNSVKLRRFASGGPSLMRSTENSGTPADSRITPEDAALQMAIHHPEQVAGRLHATLFIEPVNREAFRALEQAGGVVEACDLVSPEAAQLLHRLAVDAGNASVEDVLARVAHLTTRRVMDSLRRTHVATNDAEVRLRCNQSHIWLQSQLERLDERNTRDDALANLLPWLIDYGRRSEGSVSGSLVASQADPG
ncbi:MAG: DNA primase [Acidimicrobiaceae bacterium]|nr:DNA primase [Acidimicrobiaceae bacterium]MXZ64177.1 DNA primase [Acidimicrobiaceae bacterium]MYF33492.1 DNA primase [Acidimicrobiaceae bacterium]MYG79238.1 DNA primase [Acidimicrobiaceae bacterium]MYJ83820.1 DNA primase [Acidimicrobiaceae bacterium]